MILLRLFLVFFKVGAFTFGGGYAMLPLIREEVLAHGWLDEGQLIDFIAVSESTPGPFAVNVATYVGSEVGGVFGALCATLGVILPSFLVILIAAKCYVRFRQSKLVSGVMAGLRPAVVGLIGAAALPVAAAVFFPAGLSFSVFTDVSFYVSLGIFVLSLVLVFRKVHPILVICLSAAIGVLAGFLL